MREGRQEIDVKRAAWIATDAGQIMKWPNLWISGRAEAKAALAKWRGATAQAWEYSIGHSQLLVRLHHPLEGEKSLFLHMKGCERVSFDQDWTDAQIAIEEREAADGVRFIVTDGDRLFVQTRAVAATEWPDYRLSLRQQLEE